MTDALDAVLFDLDDTLCTYRRPPGEVLSVAFESVGVDPFFSVESYFRKYDEHFEDASGIDDLRRRAFADLASERGRDSAVGRAVADAFAAERDHSNVDPVPGAGDVVRSLAADHALGVVTNGGRGMQRQKLDALPFADAFAVVVCAGDDAPPKPSVEPFEAALSTLDTRPDRAAHVGDSLSSDVAGARAAGLRAVWLRGNDADAGSRSRKTDPEPDHVLDSLSDLLEPPWL